MEGLLPSAVKHMGRCFAVNCTLLCMTEKTKKFSFALYLLFSLLFSAHMNVVKSN